jgi:hypothetical protein
MLVWRTHKAVLAEENFISSRAAFANIRS